MPPSISRVDPEVQVFYLKPRKSRFLFRRLQYPRLLEMRMSGRKKGIPRIAQNYLQMRKQETILVLR